MRISELQYPAPYTALNQALPRALKFNTPALDNAGLHALGAAVYFDNMIERAMP